MQGFDHLRFTKKIEAKPYNIIIYLLFFCLIANLSFYVKSAEGAKAVLNNVQTTVNQDTVDIDALLEGAFTSDITDAVSSGAPTRFRFLIRFIKNRRLWPDKKIQEFEIHHTVTYDVLKKEYLVTRSYPDGTEDNLSTTEWEEMAQWMSELKSVSILLPEIKNRNANYHLNLRAEMKCIRIPFPLNYLLAFVALLNFDTPWVRVPLNLDTIPSETAIIGKSPIYEKEPPIHEEEPPIYEEETPIHEEKGL